MQNLTCSKRHIVVSSRILNSILKYGTRKYTLFSTKSMSTVPVKTLNRLWIPLSYHTLKGVHKELQTLQSVFSQCSYNNMCCCTWLCNSRNFSTTSSNNNNSSGDSSKGSPGNSDKGPKKDDEELRIVLHKIVSIGVCLYLFLFTLKQLLGEKTPMEFTIISWNEFVHHMLAKGEVEEVFVNPGSGRVTIVVHDGAIIKGKRSMFKKYYMSLPDLENFEEKVRKVEENLGIKFDQRVQIVYERTDEYLTYTLRVILYAVILMFLFSQFGKRMNIKSFDFISQLSRAKYTLVEPFTGKGVRFEDVAGLKEAKMEVMEFVDYLKQPERYKTLGAKVPKGALLLGPPGCGKTLLAKAVATESNVPFFSMNGSEFIEMLGGLGAARVRDLFKEGKKRAPSIIYIDEIDAIGKKRSDQSVEFSNSESERTLNQLLVEMDGMTTHEDIIVLASTNRAEVLDKALLRPGRFDRHILIDLPTLDERKQIFESHLRSLVLEGEPSKYSGYLSYLTPGFSGADIANVCNEAALHAARDNKKKVYGTDLMYAIDRTIGGLTKKTNTLTPTTKKVVAYHEAGHALVAWLLEHTDALLKVTIVPRTNMRLGFAQYSESDQKLRSKEQLFEKMCMMLGGRVAEHITFSKISTGAENDLKNVTKLAYHQIQQFGMCPAIGLISFDEESTSTKTKKIYSKKMANLMDAEVRKLIGDAYKTTEKLLNDNKDKLKLLSEALLERETLTYEDVEKLIGPPPFGKKRLVEPAEFEKPIIDESPSPEPTPS